MSATINSIIATGTTGIIVDIECHLSNNLPNIVIVGFANKAVDEAKERLRGAFSDSSVMLPRKRITINLAPADIPKADSGFDLAIAVSILLASEQIIDNDFSHSCFMGELGLDGSVKAIRGIIGKILAGRARGMTTFYIPAANMSQAQLIPNVVLVPVATLKALYAHLAGTKLITPINTTKGELVLPPQATHHELQLSEIVGQDRAKRALQIAAAGNHNVFFSGPPGTGKSMLAKALPSLLPPLTREEILEVTHLHSLASHDYNQLIVDRPFRAPHHSASHVAITGGGANLRPGEISLAHRGVLLFDELPEFNRVTLEALRQPLEDRVISIARAKDTADYPADFILVGTANPCPCGYYGTSGNCRCQPFQIQRYRQKLSGPIMDRIDLYCDVHEVQHRKLLTQTANQAYDDALRASITKARQRQQARFKAAARYNAAMTNSDIKRHAKPSNEASELLNVAAERLNISARAYMRTVKVARTIADLDDSDEITEAHISEALAYRAVSED